MIWVLIILILLQVLIIIGVISNYTKYEHLDTKLENSKHRQFNQFLELADQIQSLAKLMYALTPYRHNVTISQEYSDKDALKEIIDEVEEFIDWYYKKPAAHLGEKLLAKSQSIENLLLWMSHDTIAALKAEKYIRESQPSKPYDELNQDSSVEPGEKQELETAVAPEIDQEISSEDIKRARTLRFSLSSPEEESDNNS